MPVGQGLGVARRASPQVKQQVSVTRSIMAPTGGVNARDALANMPANDAVILDNWFPTPSYVGVRNGCAAWATGFAAVPETLAAFNGLSTRKLFAWAGANIFDVTSQAPIGAAVVSGLSSARWQTAMQNAGGGNTLICVDGVDAPLRYDGSAQGAAQLLNNLVGGSAYTAGTYTNVALTGGTGSGARATITVTAGAVTSVLITTPGTGYLVGDTLSANAASIGGTGSGFSIKVQQVGGWSTTTISGTNTLTGAALNPNNLITVTIAQQRAWYIEANTMNVWYATIAGYQGVLNFLPLGQIFKMGGYLMAMATWTVDNASGINDMSVFISSEGEVAVFQGYDPSTVATWQLVGTFRIGRPVGRRCWCKYGSDVLVICADGLAPLSKSLLTDRTQPDALLTNKIVNAINSDFAAYGNNFGWQCLEHPLGNKLILNVPEQVDAVAHQWVMNTVSTSNAWCRYKNWNATCWEVQQDSLYFGGLTSTGAFAVFLADTGTTDNGNAITVDVLPAFTYFEEMTEKSFKMARPIFFGSVPVSVPPLVLCVDFQIATVSAAPPLNVTSIAPWNTSPWNTTPWGGKSAVVPTKNWLGVNGIGYAAAGRLTFQVKNIALQWHSIDYLYERGGPL
jgi:hypothetical protein